MRVAGIDVGLKRIGLALSLDKKIVFPQNAILRKNRKQASRDVKNFLIEWEIEEIVVGLPKGGSTQDEMERRIKHFVSLLELKNIEVYYQDEHSSSIEAKEITKGIFKHKRDGKIDSISAKIILERWLKI
jgi:putative Holliday junction resolvase